MSKLRLLLLFLYILFFWSCETSSKYNYAIKDFRKPLQPYFTKIVSKGIVMYYDSSLRNMATDDELGQLSQSEHPVLRASAFREMLHRKSVNHFEILMSHLNDTAIVATDAGEFGIWSRTVSDDILQEATWKTKDEKNETIEKVLIRHNYLRSAYLILLKIEPQEKYYTYIKNMATQPRHLSKDGYELGFRDIEFALYGLAKFKKKDDIKIIKEQLMENVSQLSDVSFSLMKEFPDTAYFDILQIYHHRRFYRFSGNRRDGFSGFIADRADPEDFIKALVMQQNKKSAELLDTILHRLPQQTCMPDKEVIINNITIEIWEHPCTAYTQLRSRIKSKAEQILKGRISIAVEPFDTPIDTTKENIRWYP